MDLLMNQIRASYNPWRIFMKLLQKSLLLMLFTPLSVMAEVHPGKVLHDDANCMRCHADLGYNQPELTKMAPTDIKGLKKAVSFCDSNLNIGWFDDEKQDVVDYLNKTYYKFDH